MKPALSVTVDCPACGRPLEIPVTASVDPRQSTPGSLDLLLTPDATAAEQHVATHHT